jgi:ribosomal protein L19E
MMTEDEKIIRNLRKIRRQMYEETKDLTNEEWAAYYNKSGEQIIKKFGLEKYVVQEQRGVLSKVP